MVIWDALGNSHGKQDVLLGHNKLQNQSNTFHFDAAIYFMFLSHAQPIINYLNPPPPSIFLSAQLQPLAIHSWVSRTRRWLLAKQQGEDP